MSDFSEMFANHPTVIAMREEHTRERARMEREMEELLIELDNESAMSRMPDGHGAQAPATLVGCVRGAAEALRSGAKTAVRKPSKDVVISVEGGTVSAVHSDLDIRVVVLDWDVLEMGDEDSRVGSARSKDGVIADLEPRAAQEYRDVVGVADWEYVPCRDVHEYNVCEQCRREIRALTFVVEGEGPEERPHPAPDDAYDLCEGSGLLCGGRECLNKPKPNEPAVPASKESDGICSSN